MKILKFFIATFLFVWVSSSMLIFKGPFGSLKMYLVGSLATTMHGYLLRPISLFTMSSQTIHQDSAVVGVLKNVNEKIPLNENFSNINDNGIQEVKLKEPTFNAILLFIKNPKRVQVSVTPYLGRVGQTVLQMVRENHAIAGINGGAFTDTGWHGTGGIPGGITIANGKIINADNGTQPMIGISQKGVLVVGNYNLNQLKKMQVTNAMSFGPTLIQNGIDLVTSSINLGWGLAPRTAIAQERNGTIIFLVTDGRDINGVNDIGASLGDVAQILMRYGAYTAANLDGGSSTTMVYNNQIINTPTDFLGARKVATSFIVKN